jgi:hypothetical protein
MVAVIATAYLGTSRVKVVPRPNSLVNVISAPINELRVWQM